MARTARHSPNWGGARPGAGRKPRPPLLVQLPERADPLQWLLAAMNHEALPLRLRMACAVALLPYWHIRKG